MGFKKSGADFVYRDRVLSITEFDKFSADYCKETDKTRFFIQNQNELKCKPSTFVNGLLYLTMSLRMKQVEVEINEQKINIKSVKHFFLNEFNGKKKIVKTQNAHLIKSHTSKIRQSFLILIWYLLQTIYLQISIR